MASQTAPGFLETGLGCSLLLLGEGSSSLQTKRPARRGAAN